MAASATERTPLLQNETSLSGNPIGDAASRGPAETAVDAVQHATRGKSSTRVVAPDLTRGLLMLLMAIDHASINMGAYPHGQNVDGEHAAKVVTRFSAPLAYFLRTLTHLCAPGFAMLVGMGLAYWSHSYVVVKQQSWGALTKHLSYRALAILVLNMAAYWYVAFEGFWMLNAVLWAFAIDYFLVGLLAVSLQRHVEPALEQALSTAKPSPASANGESPSRNANPSSTRAPSALLIDASLLGLSAVLTWLCIWLAPTHGRCPAAAASPTRNLLIEGAVHAQSPWTDAPDCALEWNLLYRFFFEDGVICPNLGVISGFPPFGWIGLVVFGLFYGRILRRKVASATVINSVLAVAFALLFVSTRVFQYGNLSTDCLRTPAQLAQPHGSNPYLANFQSFFYLVKYPPSPAYTFGTLSGTFVLLLISEFIASTKSLARVKYVLLVFGTNALFFYAVHQQVLAGVGILVRISPLAHNVPDTMYGRGVGLSPWFALFYTISMVLCFYLCKAYAAFRATKGPDSPWRFV